jgi:hypothetical protein
VPDPLEVLNGIMGKQSSDKPAIVEPSKPTHLIEKVDFDGLSLEEYVARGNATTRMMNTEAGVETIQHCKMGQPPDLLILELTLVSKYS